MCFCALFSLLNVEEVYNDTLSLLIVILLTSNLPSCMCLSGEDLHGPPPYIIMVSEPMQLPYTYRGAAYS